MPALALGQLTNIASSVASLLGSLFGLKPTKGVQGMHINTAQQDADEIVEEFSFFDDWADRYQHLIDQGRRLTPMEVALHRASFSPPTLPSRTTTPPRWLMPFAVTMVDCG